MMFLTFLLHVSHFLGTIIGHILEHFREHAFCFKECPLLDTKMLVNLIPLKIQKAIILIIYEIDNFKHI